MESKRHPDTSLAKSLALILAGGCIQAKRYAPSAQPTAIQGVHHHHQKNLSLGPLDCHQKNVAYPEKSRGCKKVQLETVDTSLTKTGFSPLKIKRLNSRDKVGYGKRKTLEAQEAASYQVAACLTHFFLTPPEPQRPLVPEDFWLCGMISSKIGPTCIENLLT